uniref:Zinc transporter ZIP13 n=1 Tax=Petromyzon marinus TaxID=7757 RepID=S4RU04_PETMA
LGAWVLGLGGACLVGLSGVLPILLIPENTGAHLQSPEGGRRLRFLLSFAVGGLLGDVFLHLLPETWQHGCTQGAGLWVTVGLLTFLVLEKVFPDVDEDEPPATVNVRTTDSDSNRCQWFERVCPLTLHKCSHTKAEEKRMMIDDHRTDLSEFKSLSGLQISGYLNLFANCVDNFTHGLAVAGSFLVSHKVGYLTTLAILLHEIPHEV